MIVKHNKKESKVEFNFFFFKGILTFEQFIKMLIIIFGGIAVVCAIAFSSFAIKSKYFSYDKSSVEIQTKDIKIK